MVNMFVHSLHGTYKSGMHHLATSITWLVCSAWEFSTSLKPATVTSLWVILAEYFFPVI